MFISHFSVRAQKYERVTVYSTEVLTSYTEELAVTEKPEGILFVLLQEIRIVLAPLPKDKLCT